MFSKEATGSLFVLNSSKEQGHQWLSSHPTRVQGVFGKDTSLTCGFTFFFLHATHSPRTTG